MAIFEPRWHLREREVRDVGRYPELAFSDVDELLRIDRANVRDGLPLTSFGQLAVSIFARIGISDEDRREIEAKTRAELSAAAAAPIEAQPPLEALAPSPLPSGLSPQPLPFPPQDPPAPLAAPAITPPTTAGPSQAAPADPGLLGSLAEILATLPDPLEPGSPLPL